MVDFNIYKAVHAYVQALDGLFAAALCFFAQLVYFLFNAAVDEIKCRGSNQNNQKKDGGIKPDDENEYEKNDQTFADDVDEWQKYAGGKVHRIEVYFVQKVCGAIADDFFKRLIDDVVKCVFGKVLHQSGAQFMNASLYKNSKNVFEDEKCANTSNQGNQEFCLCFKSGKFIYSSQFPAFCQKVAVYGQHQHRHNRCQRNHICNRYYAGKNHQKTPFSQTVFVEQQPYAFECFKDCVSV